MVTQPFFQFSVKQPPLHSNDFVYAQNGFNPYLLKITTFCNHIWLQKWQTKLGVKRVKIKSTDVLC